MHKCPKCKGSKQIEISVSVFGSNDAPTKTKIDCVHCNGTGEVTDIQLEAIEYENNMWCKCEDDHGSKYYDDGEHPEIHKHHYRCKKCKQVTQIG